MTVTYSITERQWPPDGILHTLGAIPKNRPQGSSPGWWCRRSIPRSFFIHVPPRVSTQNVVYEITKDSSSIVTCGHPSLSNLHSIASVPQSCLSNAQASTARIWGGAGSQPTLASGSRAETLPTRGYVQQIIGFRVCEPNEYENTGLPGGNGLVNVRR